MSCFRRVIGRYIILLRLVTGMTVNDDIRERLDSAFDALEQAMDEKIRLHEEIYHS